MLITLPFPAVHDLDISKISWSLSARSQTLIPAISPTKAQPDWKPFPSFSYIFPYRISPSGAIGPPVQREYLEYLEYLESNCRSILKLFYFKKTYFFKKKLWLNEVYYCSFLVDVVPSQANAAKVTVLYVVAHLYLRSVLSYDYTAGHRL